ncbi:MAG: hypothetical protein OES32_00915 [Acidobacteriota bacterium]|nr:hypothetical protein [Acidobacteriota bacterium]MDH3522121.1 hypothetical protein [Acidobacteriota bacterium]
MSATSSPGIRWWLAAAAVHLVLLGLYHWPEAKVPLGDERMYLRAAAAVAEEGRSGLGSLWPPGYAWFLAPLLAWGGGAVWPVQLAQSALLVLAALLLRRILRREIEDPRVGDLAALLVVAYPPLAAFAHFLWPEVLHLALMLGAVAWLLHGRARATTAIGGGILLALALQTKVLLLPFLVPLAAGLWLRWPPRRRLPLLAALAVTVGLGVLPTVLAQQRDFGRPMLANSGLFNAWVGLNDVSTNEFENPVIVAEYRRYMQSARSPLRRDRILRRKIATLVRERGPWTTLAGQLRRQYFRLFDRDSFLTQQLAGGVVWARGDGYRSGGSLAARWIAGLSRASWAAVLPLAALGIAIFPYRRRPFGWWVLGFLASQCALFLVLHVKTRYRVQMLPAFFLFAAYAAVRLRDLWSRRRAASPLADPPPVPAWRWATGAALAGLLLFLAFGG